MLDRVLNKGCCIKPTRVNAVFTLVAPSDIIQTEWNNQDKMKKTYIYCPEAMEEFDDNVTKNVSLVSHGQ